VTQNAKVFYPKIFMSQSFPPPPIQPLEQLHVKDGLMINAERWRRAHDYHQQRQNMLYQALNQPGIVAGLGIHLVAAPSEVPAKYRDQRWLEVQPGLAIDLSGNLIVVPHPVVFRIAAGETPMPDPMTVYLMISHVDPKNLVRREQPEVIQETFRLDEKTSPPEDLEIELCRIQLKPGEVELRCPDDVLDPEINQIDLRHRLLVQARPQGLARVALLQTMTMSKARSADPYTEVRHLSNLDSLLEAASALYPSLRGAPAQKLSLSEMNFGSLQDCNCLFFPGTSALTLDPNEVGLLKQFLETGGVFVAEVFPEDSSALASIQTLAQDLNISLQSLYQLPPKHPLKTQPFLFSALPGLYGQEIQILCGEGMVVMVGELSSAWGANSALAMSRGDIRTAQEFGINILHFASKRRSLKQLLS
jgi:Domain of unknown function (DUF4159)